MRNLIGVGVLVGLAFVIRFGASVPIALDIYIHDTYRVVPLRVVSFWALLGSAAVWLLIAISKVGRHHS